MNGMQNYFRQQSMGANKRERTRSILIDTAIDVFSEKGIEEASVNEITAMAGLANGTFYNHFKDKDELALAAAQAIAFELAQQLDQEMQGLHKGVSRIVVASWAFLQLACSVEPWAHVIAAQYQRRPAINPSPFAYMKADIELAVSQGDVDAALDGFLLEQIAALMMAALRRLLSGKATPDTLARTCENILRILGLTPAQARREVDRVAGHPLLAPDNARLKIPGRFTPDAAPDGLEGLDSPRRKAL